MRNSRMANSELSLVPPNLATLPTLPSGKNSLQSCVYLGQHTAAILVPFILFQRTANPSLFLSVLLTHNASFTLSFLLVIKHINLVLVSGSWRCSFLECSFSTSLRSLLGISLEMPSLTTLPETPCYSTPTYSLTCFIFLQSIYYYLRWCRIFVASLFHHHRPIRRLGSLSFHHCTLYLSSAWPIVGHKHLWNEWIDNTCGNM